MVKKKVSGYFSVKLADGDLGHLFCPKLHIFWSIILKCLSEECSCDIDSDPLTAILGGTTDIYLTCLIYNSRYYSIAWLLPKGIFWLSGNKGHLFLELGLKKLPRY